MSAIPTGFWNQLAKLMGYQVMPNLFNPLIKIKYYRHSTRPKNDDHLFTHKYGFRHVERNGAERSEAETYSQFNCVKQNVNSAVKTNGVAMNPHYSPPFQWREYSDIKMVSPLRASHPRPLPPTQKNAARMGSFLCAKKSCN